MFWFFFFVLLNPQNRLGSDCNPLCLRPSLEVGREAPYLLPLLLRWNLRWRGLRVWRTLLSLFWRALEQEGQNTLSLCLCMSFSASTACGSLCTVQWITQYKNECENFNEWLCACGETGPAVRPRNVRKTTVMSGNQQDRGREQLDQVSPLYIDSFFPFACVHLRKWVCLTVSVLEAS